MTTEFISIVITPTNVQKASFNMNYLHVITGYRSECRIVPWSGIYLGVL